MATKIFPSTNDINGGIAGDGNKLKEKSFADLLSLIVSGTNKIYTGFALPATDADLIISIPLGSAIVSGRYVIKDAAENLTLAASATNHIFLQVALDASNNATAANFVANTTGAYPTNSIKLGTATTNATAVTSSATMPVVVGIGTAPDTNHDATTVAAALEVGEWGLVQGRTDSIVEFSRNAKIVAGAFVYRNSGEEAQLLEFGAAGGIRFFTAPAGTAGAVIAFTTKLVIPNAAGAPMTYEGNEVRHDGNIFHGRVGGGGTSIRLPSGWSSSKPAVNRYRITHSFGHNNYSVVPGMEYTSNPDHRHLFIIRDALGNYFDMIVTDSIGDNPASDSRVMSFTLMID